MAKEKRKRDSGAASRLPTTKRSSHRSKVIVAVTDADRVLERLRAMPEVDLHTQVVFPLLRAKGARNVQYVHGSFEKGKDILYTFVGFHGQPRLEVCQVKNQPFTGRAGNEHHLLEIITQLKQCRATEIRNPETGRSERPRGVVLYSTYELPDRDTIGLGHFFQELDELECDIIGPDKLVDQLREHLPDLHADYSFPGGGLFRTIRRYVDIHHEAPAFDLRSGQRKALKDCFVNLGVGQAGQLLDRLARGELKVRSLGPVSIQNQHLLDLQVQYDLLKDKLGGLNLLHESAAKSIQPSKLEDETGKPTTPPKKLTKDRRTQHTQLESIPLPAFLAKAERYLTRYTPGTTSTPRPSLEQVVEGISFLHGCDKFIETFATALREEDGITVPAPTEGYRFLINEVPAASLLALNENLCILGGAGAGKSSVARELARVILDRGESCIYFPCSRLTDSDRTLEEEINVFLRELHGGRGDIGTNALRNLKWISWTDVTRRLPD